MTFRNCLLFILLAICVAPNAVMAQADQGSITGLVQDLSGAILSHANVTLTSLDTGFVLKTKTDDSGVYVFSPVKIGNYRVTATAPSFGTTTKTDLHLSIQQRLNVVVTLKPGAATETVTVTSEEPLMQTQESSVGQTMDAKTINSIPIAGGNWVYIAQLAAGAVPPQGSRGGGKGDFNSNGQRAEQNNFILDGVDNNVNVVDFYNGASYAAQPPTQALAEFKLQTSDYSAEFGHSAGSVVNASLKSGTNSIHASAWEYVRNTIFDIKDWNFLPDQPVSPYHDNLFGVTLGLPIIRNKLFFFGDVQVHRVSYSTTTTQTVPSMKERTGDLSELLDPNINGYGYPIRVYYQTPSAPPQQFPNNNMNGIPGVTPNATALAILNLYPMPNANNGQLWNNYVAPLPAVDNTFQWDARMDWNINAKDNSYSRFSYGNEPAYYAPPLGPILDGGGFGTGANKNLSENFMLSETHVFTPTLTNEIRAGYNYMHTGFTQANASNPGFAGSLGFGGIPGGTLNGGLPSVSIYGISGFGSPNWSPTDEHENVYQILDNVTKIAGNHALKMGVNFQSVRFSTLQPQQSRGSYNYNGYATWDLSSYNAGFGIADFLLDSMNGGAGLSNKISNGDARWYDALYFQDDWRITPKLTVNLGVRWDYYQPYKDVGGYQASYNPTGPVSLNTTTGIGSGSAQYLIPAEGKAYAQSIFQQTGNLFPNLLAQDNISLVYTGDPHIIKAQHTNFAPRLGISFSLDGKTVIRAGYGIFYGGLESLGYWPNLGENYPFQYASNYPAPSCGTYSCPGNGITIANGFSPYLSGGFANDVSSLTLRGSDLKAKTPYTQDYNLSVERSITRNMVATVSYVGDNSHHLQVFPDPNNPLALVNPQNSPQSTRPFPDFGGSSYTSYSANSNYNSLQTKLEKRFSGGNSLLATYTWSHALDDSVTPLGSNGDWGYRNSNLIPIRMDYSNTPFDTRHRFTFDASYDLPFGWGRKFLNRHGIVNAILGGWSTNTTFQAQTGNPFTVFPTGLSAAAGGQAFAVKIKDPFAAGGTWVNPDPTISGPTCAARTRTRANWYNPCSFVNPWNPNDFQYEPQHYIPTSSSDPNYPQAQQPVYVTSLASVIGYLGGSRDQVYGPGYQRVNMSVFKNFRLYREQNLQFRCDIFNLFNTPSLALPSDISLDSKGGNITSPRFFQNLTPDARFFQLSMKYEF